MRGKHTIGILLKQNLKNKGKLIWEKQNMLCQLVASISLVGHIKWDLKCLHSQSTHRNFSPCIPFGND